MGRYTGHYSPAQAEAFVGMIKRQTCNNLSTKTGSALDRAFTTPLCAVAACCCCCWNLLFHHEKGGKALAQVIYLCRRFPVLSVSKREIPFDIFTHNTYFISATASMIMLHKMSGFSTWNLLLLHTAFCSVIFQLWHWSRTSLFTIFVFRTSISISGVRLW